MSKKKDWISILEKELKAYRKEAKRANQRMLRLERYSDPTSDMYRPIAKEVKKFAYKVAQRDLKALAGEEATRFKENYKLPTDSDDAKKLFKKIQQLRGVLHTFLSSASSTIDPIKKGKEIVKPGLRNVYDKRTDTINSKFITKYGVEGFTPLELAKFFNSAKYEDMHDDYGSDRMFVVAATIARLPTDPDDIRDFLKKHIDIDNLSAKDLKLIEEPYMNDEKLNELINKGEAYKLFQLIQLTKSKVLNNKIKKALKAGITPENIFYS